MRTVFLVGAMILLYTLQSLLCKKYAEHYPGREDMASPVFTLCSGAVVVPVSFAFLLARQKSGVVKALFVIL